MNLRDLNLEILNHIATQSPFFADSLGNFCFYCLKNEKNGHHKNCIYLKAKELLEALRANSL